MYARRALSHAVGVRTSAALRAAAAVLLPILVATSCDDLLGPDAAPEVYVLSYVGGVALDTSENLLVRCMPQVAETGAEFYFLGDTLLLRSNGTGRWRSHQASSRPDGDSTVVSRFEVGHEFRYLRLGRHLTTWNDEFRSELLFVEGGALQVSGFCGSVRYERVRGAAP